MTRDDESIRLCRAGASDQVDLRYTSNLSPLKGHTKLLAIQMVTEIFHGFHVAVVAHGVEADEAAGDFVQIGAHNLSSGDGISLRGPTAAAVIPNEPACP